MNTKRVIRFFTKQLRKESGAITVLFAIMTPLVLAFYSVAFDGAKVQAERARLADALNQGILAVAMTDNRNVTAQAKAENITLLKDYLEYYMPGATIPTKDLDIIVVQNKDPKTGRVTSVDYSTAGKAVVQPIFKGKANGNGPGFSKDIDVYASSGAGVVRKSIEEISTPTDFAFVLDFSGSMLSASSEPGMTRIALLKKVVTEFTAAILEKQKEGSSEETPSTISIIPFSLGVPVDLGGAIKNAAGGNAIGCSFAGRLLMTDKEYLAWDFWYNKTFYPTLATDANEKAQAYAHDQQLYNYYRNVIGPALGYSVDEMVSLGWCVYNAENSGSTVGKALYSCDRDPKSNLLNNYNIYKSSRNTVTKMMKRVYDDAGSYNSVAGLSILNHSTVSYEGTLDEYRMFSDEAVTTYQLHYAKPGDRPYRYMCVNGLPDTMTDIVARDTITKVKKPTSYLIEQTSDKAKLDEFASMDVVTNAGTDSSSGLLRALPVIAKGTNERKIIIIISDGEDSGDNLHGPKQFQKELHKRGMCDKIKEGLKRQPIGTKTKYTDIYFISTVNDNSGSLEFWADNCTGQNNSILATNYKQLIETLLTIAQKGSINYINKEEQ